MSVTVVSGASPAGMLDYGQRFLDSFARFWPDSVTLQFFVEEPVTMPRSNMRMRMHDDCRGLRAFVDAHRDIPEHNGQRPAHLGPKDTKLPGWRQAEWEENYSFRLDAVKFCRQLHYPLTASEDMNDGDVLVWLDGDCITLKPVDPRMFSQMIGGHFDGCFLGRPGRHSEIGYWAVRLDAETRHFLALLVSAYRTERVFQLPETHSAYVWDHIRERMRMNFRNLTPNGKGNVFEQSPLRGLIRHDKGRRKPSGTRG